MQDIYNEYSRMRQGGMDAKSVLNTLRDKIGALNKIQRDELGSALRAWEARSAKIATGTVTALKPDAARPGAIKPLKPLSASSPAAPVQTTPAQPETRETSAVICTKCGKPNRTQDVFCYSCGQPLDASRISNETRNFNGPDSGHLDSEYFGPDTVLALRVRGSTDPYEIRLEKSDQEIIVGRNTNSSAMAPDIDLGTKQGADLGVSRMHLSIRYDRDNHAVLVSDLGSANGSFINGQRLLAKEVRVLRHGDELRLGKLVMSVSFRHPNVNAQQ